MPERSEPLQSVGTAGGKLFASWRKDVATRAYVFSLDGKLENEIVLPGLGTAGGFGGLNDDKYVFYSFTSFNFPPTIYKYDIATKKSTVFRTVDIPGFKPENYETKQVFYNSKDGTRVPMFLVYKKGLQARRQQSNAALWIWWLQCRHSADVQFAAIGSARTGRGLCLCKHARRWRVRREVARGRNETEEAKCL